jgi:hypothetical protein
VETVFEQIADQGRKVVELFTECTAAPDDLDVARSADEALRRLEILLTNAEAVPRVNGLGSAWEADQSSSPNEGEHL